MASPSLYVDRFYKYESARIEWTKYFEEKEYLPRQARIVKEYFSSFFSNHRGIQLTIAVIFDETTHPLLDRDQFLMIKEELEKKLGRGLPKIRDTDISAPRGRVLRKEGFTSLQQYKNYSVRLRNENNKIREKHRREAEQHARDLRGNLTPNKTFLAFDLEMYELDHESVLEIGSVLFTMEEGVPPRYFHAIITDNLHLSNHEHVPDNREHFRFGTSMRMTLKEAAEHLDKEIAGADFLVAHAGMNDDLYLTQNGIGIKGKKIFDTQVLALALLRRGPACWGLKGILEEMKIDFEEGILHNAGNDSHYTMEAFKALAKKA